MLSFFQQTNIIPFNGDLSVIPEEPEPEVAKPEPRTPEAPRHQPPLVAITPEPQRGPPTPPPSTPDFNPRAMETPEHHTPEPQFSTPAGAEVPEVVAQVS